MIQTSGASIESDPMDTKKLSAGHHPMPHDGHWLSCMHII